MNPFTKSEWDRIAHSYIISHRWTVSSFLFFFQWVTVYCERKDGVDEFRSFIQFFGDARHKTKCPICGRILIK